MKNNMKGNNQFSVAVCIVTYNQDKYIAQAIESVLSQKTDFEVAMFIGNDCSTDQTLAICSEYQQKYPEKIRIITPKQNIGTVANTFAVFREILKEKEKYRYIAMLDGDDYWCDKDKLQKQIDFLENNFDYGLIHTRMALLDNQTGIVHYSKAGEKEIPTGYIFPQTLELSVANCTVVIRTELLEYVDMAAIENLGLLSCDYITNVVVSKWSKVGFIDEVTAVWRRNISSVSSPKQLENSLKYIDHEINSGRYLSSLFPEVYPFTQAEQERYIARRKMEIALALENYKLAKETLNSSDIFKNRKMLVLSLKNSMFFSVFIFVRRLNKAIRQKTIDRYR